VVLSYPKRSEDLNQFQLQQKASYSLLINMDDGTNSNDSKKRCNLYLFMPMMEPISMTAKAWYSLLVHVEDGINSNDSKSVVFFTYS
jgi:hypothetical protein